jgi:hypothetical protein
MTGVLSVSSILLVCLLIVRHIEFKRGNTRFFELPRRRLDRVTVKCTKQFQIFFQKVLRYTHRDIFLSGLHMVTYVALLFVRLVENRLDRIAKFLRSFRGDHKKVRTSKNLRVIHREDKTVVNEEK